MATLFISKPVQDFHMMKGEDRQPSLRCPTGCSAGRSVERAAVQVQAMPCAPRTPDCPLQFVDKVRTGAPLHYLATPTDRTWVRGF